MNTGTPQVQTSTPQRILRDACCSVGLLTVAALAGAVFDYLGLSTCIVICFMLAVQGAALLTEGRVHCVVVSIMAVALYNFLFAYPRYSWRIIDVDGFATAVLMLAAALASAWLSGELRYQVGRSRRISHRNEMVLEAEHLLASCDSVQGVIDCAALQIAQLTDRVAVWYQPEGAEGEFFATCAYAPDGQVDTVPELAPDMPPVLGGSAYLGAPLVQRFDEGGEHGVYLTVYGAPGSEAAAVDGPRSSTPGTTDVNRSHTSDSAAAAQDAIAPALGMMGIAANRSDIYPSMLTTAAAIMGEASLAIERLEALEAREHAALLAKNEQLRANLLRSISHDLRTPLTAICGNADILLSDSAALDGDQRRRLLESIMSDSSWLRATVENLLAITRLEDGGVNLKPTVELMDDVVEEALRHISPAVSHHTLTVDACPDIALVNVDARLMVQVILNLVDNAIAHTQDGSHILIRTQMDADSVITEVEDDGPGISAQDRPHVFDSFYTAQDGAPDSHRSVGLGLALCRSIVTAHAGTIELEPASPHGCIFRVILPAASLE